MSTTNQTGGGSALAGRLQQQAENKQLQQATASPAATVEAYFKKIEKQIAQSLPSHLNIERMTRIALTTIRTNPKLLECTLPSLAAAVLQAAQLGLEPGIMGQCYLIPFKNNKQNITEVQFIIGYKGMIDLARRSGHIQSIEAQVVYENDQIELEYGLESKLRHVPWFMRKDQKQTTSGKIIGAYMVAKFKDGGHQIHYMPEEEILQHRARSNGYQNAVRYNRTDNPWFTDAPEMYKKTVVRAGIKWLPISVEDLRLISKDEAVHSDVNKMEDDGTIIDITGGSSTEEPDPQQGGEGGVPDGAKEIDFDK